VGAVSLSLSPWAAPGCVRVAFRNARCQCGRGGPFCLTILYVCDWDGLLPWLGAHDWHGPRYGCCEHIWRHFGSVCAKMFN
jgi:hypothetical protein